MELCRFALGQECMEVFGKVMAQIEYTCFLDDHDKDYTQVWP